MAPVEENQESDIRSVAFYLPQYHPSPENDRWWQPGFSEWHNVVMARPQFRGHHQPQLPGELGFYDLRLAETRDAQAELAAAYGIDAFCIYHYWFEGRRLLHEPIDRVMATGRPDFPFMLCWANESWTRAWDGRTGTVLVEQKYSEEDDLRHIRHLLPIFADPRYLRMDGRPLFLVYRAGQLPDPQRTTDLWRRTMVAEGLPEPLLARVEGLASERGDPLALGFDAAVEFQPDWRSLFVGGRLSSRVRSRVATVRSLQTMSRGHRIVEYDTMVDAALAKQASHHRRWRCVTPGWDNTARRSRAATILRGATPDRYERWVTRAATMAKQESTGQTLLFVNAWNEWAEGCHLEPDTSFGRSFLQAHARGIGVSQL